MNVLSAGSLECHVLMLMPYHCSVVDGRVNLLLHLQTQAEYCQSQQPSSSSSMDGCLVVQREDDIDTSLVNGGE